MEVTCIRRLHFDAAHRVLDHESKCKFLHGHRYMMEVVCKADSLDNLGRVIDFGVIKQIVKNWIDDNLDHNVILYKQDQSLGEAIALQTKQKIFYLPYNPTAENIAIYLLKEVFPVLLKGHRAQIISVKLFETPNCIAEVRL